MQYRLICVSKEQFENVEHIQHNYYECVVEERGNKTTLPLLYIATKSEVVYETTIIFIYYAKIGYYIFYTQGSIQCIYMQTSVTPSIDIMMLCRKAPSFSFYIFQGVPA